MKISRASYSRAKREARQGRNAAEHKDLLLKAALVRMETAFKYLPMDAKWDKEASFLERTINDIRTELGIVPQEEE